MEEPLPHPENVPLGGSWRTKGQPKGSNKFQAEESAVGVGPGERQESP